MGTPLAIVRPVAVEEPDAATLEGCRRGDGAALERVLLAHGPLLKRLLARLAGPGDDVEDLLQTTFIEAIRAFPGFRGEASVRTWLSRIAVRTAQNRWRSPERRRRVQLEIVGSAAEPQDGAPGPELHAEQRRRVARLYEHLEKIGAKKRVAFMLHVFDGRPIEEVAALMGATPAATKSRVFWARRALFARLRRDPVLAELFAEPRP